ncbi:MAG: tripartite tricarboxylate transporter permease [Candidatus Woesearchaeota archaeon]|jgi:putative membrane protein|nr:tripartite tricarboxylate transporter permease [Candidatus Woesearchaeota archaeon]MDP7180796.1 tripartite tricarboxylate transporter permease [Candidatus Woesearchaeota archaeon]
MFLELVVALVVGVVAGIFTGLIPGVHINLVSILLVSVSGYFLGFTSPLVLGVFIIAMSVTHSFLDSIPSVFLGAPDPDMALAVLPGHRLLLEGRGYEAVKLTVIGSLLSLIMVVLLIPVLIPVVPFVYEFIQPYIGWILVAVVVYMILKEIGLLKKLWGTFVFMLSGILGIIVFSIPNLKQPLFPMLSGLFGVSTLLMSLTSNTEIPEQKITEEIKVEKKNLVKAVGAATFSGSLTGLFPGLGSAQAAIIAIIAVQIVGDIGAHAFMVLIGGINTVNFVFSLATFFTLSKARNGAIVAVMEILESINVYELVVFLAVALIVGGIASFLAMKITKVFAKFIGKVNYRILCLSVIGFISVLVLYFSSFIGFLILLVSTVVGLIPGLVNVKRSLAMGCLLLPVIYYFVF